MFNSLPDLLQFTNGPDASNTVVYLATDHYVCPSSDPRWGNVNVVLVSQTRNLTIDFGGSIIECPTIQDSRSGGNSYPGILTIGKSFDIVLRNVILQNVPLGIYIFVSSVSLENVSVISPGGFSVQVTDLTYFDAAHGVPCDGCLPSVVTVSGCYFANSRAYIVGGAVRVFAYDNHRRIVLTLRDTVITNSTVIFPSGAKGTTAIPYALGMAVALSNTDARFERVTIDGGRASSENIYKCASGNIFLSNTTLLVADSWIGNAQSCGAQYYAGSGGGGLTVTVGCTVTVVNTVFSNNVAYYGGAIFVAANDVCTAFSTVAQGAMKNIPTAEDCYPSSTPSMLPPVVMLTNVTITGNTAINQGGGLYMITPSRVTLNQGTQFLLNKQNTPGPSAFYCINPTNDQDFSTIVTDGSITFKGNNVDGTNQAASCPACGCCAPTGKHANVPESGGLPNNAVPYSCTRGYNNVTDSFTCDRSLAGTVQNPIAEYACQPIACPTLYPPAGTHAVPTTGYHGSSSFYSCDPGYDLSGPKTVACVAGAWDATPVCIPRRCNETSLDVALPPHGVYANFDSLPGANVTFTCEAGYTLTGSAITDCQLIASGGVTWRPRGKVAPACVPTTCSTTGVLGYFSTCGAVADYKQECTFGCIGGYFGPNTTTVCDQSTTGGAGIFIDPKSLSEGLPNLCVPCRKNTYSMGGMDTCVPCLNSITGDSKSNSSADCLCSPEFYEAVPDSGACVACPTGASCTGNKSPPVAAPSYIQSNGAFILCVPTEACVGNSVCGVGYTGHLCGTCAEGFYRLSGHCVACKQNATANLVAALILAGILIMLLPFAASANIMGGRENNAANPTTILFFLQIIAVFQDVRFQWPSSIIQIFNIFSAFNFNIDLLNLECTVPGFNFYSRLYFYLSLPLIVLPMFGLVLAVVLWKARRTATVVSFETTLWAELRFIGGGVLLFLNIAYIPIARYTFAAFACFQQADGITVLALAPSELCYTPAWKAAVGYAVFGVIFYVVGIPVVSMGILKYLVARRSPEAAASHALVHSYVGRFKREQYYWEATIFFRKFWVTLFLSIFAQQPVLQAVLCGAVLFIACLATTIGRPLVLTRDNYLESVSLACSFSVLFAGLIAAPTTVSEATRDAIGGVTLAIVIIMLIILVLAALLDVRRYVLNARKAMSLQPAARNALPTRVSALNRSIGADGVPRLAVAVGDRVLIHSQQGTFMCDAGGRVVSVLALADGSLAIANASSGAIVNESGAIIATAPTATPLIGLASAGHYLAGATAEGILVIWTSNDKGQFAEPVSLQASGGFTVSTLHMSGADIFVGTLRGTIARVTARKAMVKSTIDAGVGAVRALASHENLLFVGGASGAIAVVDLPTEITLITLCGHFDGVTGLSVSGDLLASISDDGTVRLWNTRSFSLLASLPVAESSAVVVNLIEGDAAKNADDEALSSSLLHGHVQLWVGGTQRLLRYSMDVSALQPVDGALHLPCCRDKKTQHSEMQPVSDRVRAEIDDDAFWDIPVEQMADDLKAVMRPALLASLDDKEWRRFYRAAHVAGKVDLNAPAPPAAAAAVAHNPSHAHDQQA